jgi:phage tail-like protein
MSANQLSRYLEYLPAIYQVEPDVEAPFLGRFLLPFEEVLTGFERVLATIDHYVSPAFTNPDFLPWLATWVALVLDEEWDEAKRRSLIAEAVALYRERGTVQGLKRYLEIYTGLVPEIHEFCWPGGMQIGVASQIGWKEPSEAALSTIRRVEGPTLMQLPNYYVVELGENSEVLRLYYPDNQVREVGVEDGTVEIHLLSGEIVRHESARITRRDGLLEHGYSITTPKEGEDQQEARVFYRGDTFLVDREELPYCFIVDVRVAVADLERVDLDKVRAIVELEKPAHTRYYLRLTPVLSPDVFEMQIGVRSTIGEEHTIVG